MNSCLRCFRHLMTSLWRDPQASPGVPACTAHTAPESSGGVKVASAGLSAWVSWSRSFQTPLFMQELSKGGNGANKRSWPSWGWCVVCPTDKGRFCPCEGSSEVEKDGKPSSELSLWRTMEITSPSWVLLSWVLGPSLYQQHPAAKSGPVHRPVCRGEGRGGGKEERRVRVGAGRAGTEGTLFPTGLTAPEPVLPPHRQAASPAVDPTGCLIIPQISNQMCPTYRSPSELQIKSHLQMSESW